MPHSIENAGCAYVWVYKVKSERWDEFAAAYGADGVWARFFSKSPGYIRTEMLIDAHDPNRFSTIDYFKDRGARPALVEKYADEFAEIDKRWEEATLEETFIGEFLVEKRR